MTHPQPSRPPASLEFRFWTPPEGYTVITGADEHPVVLPQLPLPVHRQVLVEGEPPREDIGQGLYDYLRQYPDCHHNHAYAELLRDVFPHFLADLGAHAIMLDHKEVDPPYIRRKINALKILALLEPENAPLQQQIGRAYFQLALTFSEMAGSRHHLQATMRHLGRALKLAPEDVGTLNLLAQIDYFLGDYPAAARRWQQALELAKDQKLRTALAANLARVTESAFPEVPLIDDFEAVGTALELCGHGRFAEARVVLDALEERGRLPVELPSAEFFFLVGFCREKTGDAGGAFTAYAQALELDPDFAPATEGRARLLEEG